MNAQLGSTPTVDPIGCLDSTIEIKVSFSLGVSMCKATYPKKTKSISSSWHPDSLYVSTNSIHYSTGTSTLRTEQTCAETTRG